MSAARILPTSLPGLALAATLLCAVAQGYAQDEGPGPAGVAIGTQPGEADELAWDWPALACRRNGETWLACVEWRDGADAVVLRSLAQDVAAQLVLYRSPARILGTALAVDEADALHVVWSEQQSEGWALRGLVVGAPARAGEAGAPGEVTTLLARPGAHLLWPALAADEQRALLLTCVALGLPQGPGAARGPAVLALARPAGGAWSAPVAVSTGSATPWSASAASTGAGRFAIVWDAAADGDYDVQLAECELAADGAPRVTGRHRITDSPRRESHPSAAFDGSRLYVAYDVAGERWGREGSVNKLEEALHAGRTLEVVAVQDGRVAPLAQQPADGMNDVLARNCELPRLAVESTGNLVLLFRGLPLPPALSDPEDPAFAERMEAGAGTGWRASIWFTYLTRLDGSAWRLGDKHHLGVPGSEGRADAGAALARLPGGGHAYAVVGDGRDVPRYAKPEDGFTPEQARAFDAETSAWGRPLKVEPTKVTLGMLRKEPRRAPIALGPSRPLPAALPAEAAPTDAPDAPRAGAGGALPRRTLADGRVLQLALGDLHRHTDLSRCSSNWDGPFEDALRYALDVAPLQFLAITDHIEHMVGWDTWRSASWADAYDVPGRFTSLRAYERAEPRTGHRNIIARGPGPPLVGYRNSWNPRRDDVRADSGPELWPALPEGQVISIPHTPAGMFPKSPSSFDWSGLQPRWDRLVELFQSYRGSSEADGAPRAIPGLRPERYVQPNLDRGMHFGFIASSDHQTSDGAFAGAWVAELTRDGVFDALHARLTFAATVRGALWAEWAGVPMGRSAVVPQGARGEFLVEVDGFGRELSLLELIADGAVVEERAARGSTAAERFELELPAAGSRYAYVRVRFADGELMWSSPVRLSRDGGAGPDGLSGEQVLQQAGDVWNPRAPVEPEAPDAPPAGPR